MPTVFPISRDSICRLIRIVCNVNPGVLLIPLWGLAHVLFVPGLD
jgi:hypothetical protein